MKEISLQIPASTSNVGPGFDTLGIALSLYCELTVVRYGSRGFAVEFESGVEDKFQPNIRKMIVNAVRVFEEAAERKVEGVKLSFNNSIPIARGLGSSAAFRLGTLTALNKWFGEPLDDDAILNAACRLERHTENCVASMFGGLTASGFVNGRARHAKFDIPDDLTFVAVVPDRPMSTSETRKLLPHRISMKDAVFNLNRIALLIHALTAGEYDRLGELFEDRIHQPSRAKILTPLFDVISAAREAGAYGGFLSGSGSTIVAVADRDTKKIADAMKTVLDKAGWRGEEMTLKVDKAGIRVKKQV